MQVITKWLLRSAYGETGRTVESFRAYFYANRGSMEEASLKGIEDLLSRDLLGPDEFSKLAGMLIDASSHDGMIEWCRTLGLEYAILLDIPALKQKDRPAAPTDIALAAEASMLLSQVVRLRSVRRALSLMRTVCCAAGLALAIVYSVCGMRMATLIPSNGGRGINLIAIVGLLGGLGGLISGLSRLYGIQWSGSALLAYTHVSSLGTGLLLNLLLASFEGIVFAIVLYAFFTGHFVQGSLFPSVTWTQSDGSWQTFLNFGGPETPQDTGKLLIWSFAAGFSERLVPDLMRQLSAQANIGGAAKQ